MMQTLLLAAVCGFLGGAFVVLLSRRRHRSESQGALSHLAQKYPEATRRPRVVAKTEEQEAEIEEERLNR